MRSELFRLLLSESCFREHGSSVGDRHTSSEFAIAQTVREVSPLISTLTSAVGDAAPWPLSGHRLLFDWRLWLANFSVSAEPPGEGVRRFHTGEACSGPAASGVYPTGDRFPEISVECFDLTLSWSMNRISVVFPCCGPVNPAFAVALSPLPVLVAPLPVLVTPLPVLVTPVSGLVAPLPVVAAPLPVVAAPHDDVVDVSCVSPVGYSTLK